MCFLDRVFYLLKPEVFSVPNLLALVSYFNKIR